MSETNHPWCRDVSRDEAIRRAEDAAAAERTPLPDHRDLPQAVHDLRRRVEGLEAFADAWRRQCEADAENREAAPVSRKGVNADGLRTERVTLELTHRALFSVTTWAWHTVLGKALGPGESVRVVTDDLPAVHDMDGDRVVMSWPELAKCLTDERDAALRERDATLDECERLREQVVIRCTTASNLHGVIRERDQKIVTLEARVRELEFAAAAHAANAGGEQQPPRGWLTLEERQAVEMFIRMGEEHDDVDAECRAAMKLRGLLARSTPPKVKVPLAGSDFAWIAAIREAGGEVE